MKFFYRAIQRRCKKESWNHVGVPVQKSRPVTTAQRTTVFGVKTLVNAWTKMHILRVFPTVSVGNGRRRMIGVDQLMLFANGAASICPVQVAETNRVVVGATMGLVLARESACQVALRKSVHMPSKVVRLIGGISLIVLVSFLTIQISNFFNFQFIKTCTCIIFCFAFSLSMQWTQSMSSQQFGVFAALRRPYSWQALRKL